MSVSPPPSLPASVHSAVELLKSAKTRRSLAYILDYKPKTLTYLLFKKSPKYHQFEIPKKAGGKRTILAPVDELKLLQSKLGTLLQNCEIELNKGRIFASHGFRRGYSIATNATKHRNRRWVFNVDIEGFFDAINFGRVRGYFLNHKDLLLTPDVATVIAQIACHEDKLPQGSPCSPVISNLIGQILDVRLIRLAKQHKCWYSRYADDLTFSTNEPEFPKAIAEKLVPDQWKAGAKLIELIDDAGFALNPKKTRMQYRESRQVVTGLTVNRRLNPAKEYRHLVRAMTNKLVTTGTYSVEVHQPDGKGGYTKAIAPGLLGALRGMHSFIDAIDRHVEQAREPKRPHHRKHPDLSARQQTYRRFLMYSEFFATASPVILCEGETDNVYIKGAIKSLGGGFPLLAQPSATGLSLKARLYNYSALTERILAISGGTSQLASFISHYAKEAARFFPGACHHPLILLVDNDSGAKSIFSAIKNVGKVAAVPDGTAPWYHVALNLYVVPTPKGPNNADSAIETCFKPALLSEKLGIKTFNPANKIDPAKEFGKVVFANRIVKPKLGSIDFSDFAPILKAFEDVISDYAGKIAAAATKLSAAPTSPPASSLAANKPP